MRLGIATGHSGEHFPARQVLFTLPMWFAWLLRFDVRAGREIGDPEGQRAFVIWWLLLGKAAYPVEWWFGAQQVAVAMEPALRVEGVPVPWLVREIWLHRPDLREAFPLDSAESAAGLLAWYRVRAAVEYPAAPALDRAGRAAIEAPCSARPWSEGGSVPRIAVALWCADRTLQGLFDPRDAGARAGFARWFARKG